MPASAARTIVAAHAAGALMVEDCDIPAGMTLTEYRRAGAPPKRAKSPKRSALRGALKLRLA